MGNSGNLDTGTGELAPRTGEFLAGVLALSRISRVTVALESGHGAGPALLAAARMTAHAETCLLFDQWHGDPMADLATALLHDHPDLAAAADGNLAQGLRTLQLRQGHSFLVIFDRFDEYLAQSASQPHSAAFDRAFVQMANDADLDVHFLLVLDEAAEPLLGRFQAAIPGIGDGCLRMPAGAMADGQADAPAPEAGRASRRDRSFGMLLERLTTIAPVDEAAAGQPRAIAAAPEAPQADLAQPPHHRAPDQEIPPAFGSHPVNDIRPVSDDAPLHEARRAEPEPFIAVPTAYAAPAPEAGPEATVTRPAPLPTDAPARGNVLPAQPRRRARALVVLLAAVLAVGAGFYAYRQQAPLSASSKPAAGAPAAEPAAGPTVAAAPSNASAEPQPPTAAPPLLAAPALAAAAPAAPAGPAAPAVTAAPGAASPAPTRASPTVYVHVRSQRERERLQSLVRTLAEQGVRIVDVKVMATGPSVADLRYFRDEDRETALAVQKAMVSAGVEVPKLSRMNGYETSTRPGHFEAWLGDSNTPEPVQRR